MIIEVQKELKSSKSSEKKFYAQEIKKLRAEQDKLKEKLNNLFDLRLDGELDRESFDTKRNEIQVKMNRLKNKVSAHEKADNIMHGRKPEEQKTHFKSTEEPFLFRGLVRCGVCGCIMSSYKKVKPNGNEYIYLKCSHFKDCDNPQLSEVKALKPIEEELKRLYVREEIFSYIKKDLERIVNKQNEVHNREVKMVRRQYDNCQDKIKRLRSLLLEGHLTPEEYRDMNEELKKEQYELEGKSTSLTQADENFSIAITTIMSLAKNAYQIFKSSRVETQRAILNILLSNLQIKDKQISYDLRKPFDLINSLNEKTPPKIEGVAIGDPNGIRTHITTVKG